MPNHITDALEPQASKDASEKAFQAWLNKDETRLLLSIIPETGHNEIFQGILRSAYSAGYLTGQAFLGLAMVQDLFESRERK